MNASQTCLAAIFTVALACDDGVDPSYSPQHSTFGGVDLAEIALDSSDSANLTDEESTESDTGGSNSLSDTKNEFCLPFEMGSCHSITGSSLQLCGPSDCLCHAKMVFVDYAPTLAECLNTACPKHYPNPDILTSCYYDWYSTVENCLRNTACIDWAVKCTEYGATARMRFLRSCMGG